MVGFRRNFRGMSVAHGVWRLRRLPIAGLSGLLLASGSLAETALPPKRIGVSERQVVIAGPLGYCADLSAARDTPDAAFVLLGSCAAMGQSPDIPAPLAPALLTASVVPGGPVPISDQLAGLNSFFRSEAGRAALSRSGRASSVKVIEAKGRAGVFYLHARDASAPTGRGVQPDFWRAVLDVHGRIVTLTVVGLRERPLSAAAGMATLEVFVRQVQRENR